MIEGFFEIQSELSALDDLILMIPSLFEIALKHSVRLLCFTAGGMHHTCDCARDV